MAGLRGLALALAAGLAAALRQQEHGQLRADCSVGLLRGSAPTPVTGWDYNEHGRNWNMGQCCIGVGQSPMNVSMATAVEPDGDKLFHAYRVHEQPVRIVNDGKVLVAEFDASVGGIALGKSFPGDLTDQWDLWKIEAHAPSEHTFEGQTVALELQLYHKRRGTTGDPAPDAVAIVALGFVASAAPLGFVNALRQGGLPAVKGSGTLVNRQAPAKLDFTKLFGVSNEAPMGQLGTNPPAGFWQYTGSLTAPPCSVGVQWFVRNDPLPASQQALAEFQSAILAVQPIGIEGGDKGNTRSLQPACGRTIMLRMPEDKSAELNAKYANGVQDKELQQSLATSAANKAQFEKQMPDEMPEPERKFQDCLSELGRARDSMTQADARVDEWCKAEQDARANLAKSGGGVTRLADGDTLTKAKSHCNAETQVASALKAEVKTLASTCEALRLKSVAAGTSPSGGLFR